MRTGNPVHHIQTHRVLSVGSMVAIPPQSYGRGMKRVRSIRSGFALAMGAGLLAACGSSEPPLQKKSTLTESELRAVVEAANRETGKVPLSDDEFRGLMGLPPPDEAAMRAYLDQKLTRLIGRTYPGAKLEDIRFSADYRSACGWLVLPKAGSAVVTSTDLSPETIDRPLGPLLVTKDGFWDDPSFESNQTIWREMCEGLGLLGPKPLEGG